MRHAILDKLKEFDALYEGFYPWLAGQYDSSGGFYYARSSRENDEFHPDIESTGQALHIMERSDLIASMPAPMRGKLIGFFQSRQVETGYFYDPQNRMREVDRMVARALMYSAGSLRLLGASPLYPLPGQVDRGTLPPHLRSLEALREWLDERPWDYAWMGGDHVSTTAVYLLQLSPAVRQPLLDLILDYLSTRQDPADGLWGGGRPYVRVSGAFKLANFYRGFGAEMPNAERIYGSVLRALREDESEDMCWTRNPLDLLDALHPALGPYPPEDILAILTITLRNLGRYLKPDGGFSRHVDVSLAVPNDVPLGLGLAEGDMNAGTQALRIRSLAHGIAGTRDLPLRHLTRITLWG